ncbi:hypothetical protein [Actinomadura rubrisoli]|uniref:hypothetical protein n=1 Tax=Actinomadura rubrisoli TaxID=2530368 RepID=UPI001404A6DD|nr:hypothetical protein [Actinomadura rubrisoli]
MYLAMMTQLIIALLGVVAAAMPIWDRARRRKIVQAERRITTRKSETEIERGSGDG